MRPPRLWSGPHARQLPAMLVACLLLQSVAAVFFVSDAVAEVFDDPFRLKALVEGLTAFALLLGLVFGAVLLRGTLERLRTQETALAVATGSLAQVIAAQFAAWRLTPAERDVGLLALKGLDVAEIAGLRAAAQGTVRAQLTRIYAKAGVSGRAQFAAFFVEDLLGGGVSATQPAPDPLRRNA
jgi:DNA-binding CsgD family transcriptional regulator